MVALLLACVAAPVPPPEVPVGYPVDPAFTGDVAFEGATVTYYAVSGANDIEVWRSIRTNGPKLGGTVHGAHAAWDVRWDPPPDAPAASVGNWQRYVARLAFHEQGHVDRIRGAAAQIPEVLGAAGCEGIAQVGKDALTLIDALNAEYDAETQHGELEGATLFVPAP